MINKPRRNGLVFNFKCNPFFILFSFYFTSNTYFLYKGIKSGGYVLLDDFFSISAYSYFFAYVLIVIYLFLFLFFSFFSNKKTVGKNGFALNNKYSIFVIFYLFSYILFFNSTNVGVLGAERDLNSSSSFVLYYVYKIINPDLLAILLLPILKSNRLFYIGLFIYVISTLLRGWMGGVFIGGLIFLIRFYPVRISIKHVLVIAVLILSVPFLEGVKWGIRGGLDVLDVLYFIYYEYDFDRVLIGLESVFARFQHINNVALIFENMDYFKSSYDGGLFRPFYANGIFYDVYCKVTSDCLLDLNGFIVDKIYAPGAGWNVDPGMAGWFLLGFPTSALSFVFFVFFGFFVPFFISKYIDPKFYMSIMMLVGMYLLHGWISPYLNLLFLAVCFVFLAKGKLKRHQVKGTSR